LGTALYYETSAINNISVQNLFQEIGTKLFKKAAEDVIPDVWFNFNINLIIIVLLYRKKCMRLQNV
jgi:hypothetical protein